MSDISVDVCKLRFAFCGHFFEAACVCVCGCVCVCVCVRV